MSRRHSRRRGSWSNHAPSDRLAARILMGRKVPLELDRMPCGCRCHVRSGGAHDNQRCRCNGGEGYAS